MTATFWQGKKMRKLAATSGRPAMSDNRGGMLYLAPLRSPVPCVWQREWRWEPELLVLVCAALQLSPYCSLSFPCCLCLHNSWIKGKITEGWEMWFAGNHATHFHIGKLLLLPPSPGEKEIKKEYKDHLCLWVSQTMHSCVPVWISYFSPGFTFKKEQHFLLFFSPTVRSSFTWSCQVLWHLMLKMPLSLFYCVSAALL